jgi:hypothetical protein
MNDQSTVGVYLPFQVFTFGAMLQYRVRSENPRADLALPEPDTALEFSPLQLWRGLIHEVMSAYRSYPATEQQLDAGWAAGCSYSSTRVMALTLDIYQEIKDWLDADLVSESEFECLVGWLQYEYDKVEGKYPIPYELLGDGE